MGLLFVNCCLREGSRTERLARMWLERYEGDVTEVSLADVEVVPLTRDRVLAYGDAVAAGDYAGEMFDVARQFAAAEEVLIAAPLWNFALPAKLHDYLELVCSQGVTFDVGPTGDYVSLTRARRLVFVSTSGGLWPKAEDDHAFGYLETLCRRFWHVSCVEKVIAEGLDAVGCDVGEALATAIGNSL